MSRLPETLRRL
jgi:hypothetical protein